MRVYGNRRTASLQQASAHSFDGGQVPVQHQHQLSGPSAVHQQQQQQQQLHYHQANVVWPSHNDQNTPVIHRQHMGHTSSAGATHVHQHNHASLASYYGPHAYDLSLAQARETFLNNFDAAAATARPSTSAQLQQMNNQQPEVPRAGYFVVPSTTTSTSGAQHPYYGHVNYGHAHAVAQPAVESIGHTWRCDMRHTVDGGYPRRTHWTGVNSMRPMGASFDQHQLDLRQQQLNSQTGGYGMPPRQRMTSISSPTLSEYDNIDPFWGVQAGSTRTLVAPKSAHRYDHHIQHLEQNQAHQHYRDMATTSRPPPPPPRTLGYNTSHSLSMTHTGYGRHGHQRASPDPFVANSMTINQQNLVANRKLSSIMGSDSELYASSRRVGGQPAEKLYHIAQRRDKNVFNLETSPSTSSSSPSSRSSSQAAKTWTAFSEYSSGKQQQRPSTGHSSATSNKTSRKSGQVAVAAAVADRRRLTRQASSTSAASQAREPGSARPHKLAHQGRSLQVDALQARAAATVAGAAAASKTRVIGVDGGVATRGQSKSDPETRAAVNHAKARAAAKMLAGRATKIAASSGAESDTVKAAAATVATLRKGHTPLLVCGKSKSVNHHSGPMGVLGRAVSLAGAKRRLGFKQKCGLSSLSVHRSEEIMPQLEQERLERQQRRLQQQQQQQHQQQAQPSRTANERAAARRAIRMQQSSTTTGTSNSLNSVCSFNTADRHAPTEASPDGTSRWLTQFGLDPPTPKVCFVDGLGSGQIASRQALVSPYLGDIQVSLSDRRGMLEVEIIRVRQLRPKPNAPRMPSPFVKVYLMRDKKCAAKFKTSQARETLDPLYQQLFIFRDDYSNCVLQIIVWGDYGKRDDRKSLMGIVQINLNKLDMSNVVVSWYKLFNISSMVAATASAPCVVNSSKTLRQTLSSSKLHGEWATTVSQGTVFEEIKDKGGADKDDDKSRELPKLEKLKLTE